MSDDLVKRLRDAIHFESAALSPQTTPLMECARAAADRIEELEGVLREAVRDAYNPFEPDNQADYYLRWASVLNGGLPLAEGGGVVRVTDDEELIRLQEWEGRIRREALVALPDLSHVIAWLRNGCDRAKAVDELEIFAARIASARAKAEGRE